PSNLPNLRRLFVEARTEAEESAYSRNALHRGRIVSQIDGASLKSHQALQPQHFDRVFRPSVHSPGASVGDAQGLCVSARGGRLHLPLAEVSQALSCRNAQ
ncbi:hypothetical protein E4T38_03894, partial [Aureobasidium subglaciale]